MDIIFHYKDPQGQQEMLHRLTALIKKHRDVVIICIGSDRVSGDSLGPLVGTFLQEECHQAKVYGTLEEPVHAKNLEDVAAKVNKNHPDAFVIAVDACLGRVSSIENIILAEKPLKPGSGVNKELPEVGDINIQGIVNMSGFVPHLLIQNTRLHTVFNMARIIAGTLAQALIAHKHFSHVYNLRKA